MSEKVTRFYDKAAKFEVRETNDYGKFKKLLGNRDVKEKRIRQLIISIQENGFLNSSIIVNEKMEIVDGQARFEALQRLHMPIFYCIHKGAGLKECVDLNIKQGNWKLDDYCYSYIACGNDNYIRLDKLKRELNAQYATIYAIVCRRIPSGGFGSHAIKNGQIKISDNQLKQALSCKEVVNLVKQYICPGHDLRLETAAFCYAYLVDGVDQDRLINIIKNKMSKLTPYNTADLTLKEISKLYNDRLKAEKKISFDALYQMALLKD